MLAIDETVNLLSHSHGTNSDGSLELLGELSVTIHVAAAVPWLSAIVSKMLPHDVLRIVCLDQQGRPIVKMRLLPTRRTCLGGRRRRTDHQ